MAPSSGHVLVPLAMRVLRHVSKKASSFIRTKLSSPQPLRSELQPILVRNEARQPIHPAALLRQSRRRWFSSRSVVESAVRRFATSSGTTGVRISRTALPKSATGSAVAGLSRSAPFASTLRPNLTGGAIPRTAGGYALGAGRVGGARHFSHSPAAPAEVVTNVSAAVRAFWLAGQRAHFDGVDQRSGEKRFKAVTRLQDQAGRKIGSVSSRAPGSFIDFHISPTVTAMSSFGQFPMSIAPVTSRTLKADGLLHELSVDFARAVKDLAIVLEDLKRLSGLGDLPLSMLENGVIRVSFPGCDALTVERLSDEMGLRRGIVHQDEDFANCTFDSEMPLAFPLAPDGMATLAISDNALSDNQVPTERHHNNHEIDDSRRRPDEIDWQNMMSPSSSPPSDEASLFLPESSTSAWHDNGISNGGSNDSIYLHVSSPSASASACGTSSAEDYEGIEGIYRFWEQCDGRRW